MSKSIINRVVDVERIPVFRVTRLKDGFVKFFLLEASVEAFLENRARVLWSVNKEFAYRIVSDRRSTGWLLEAGLLLPNEEEKEEQLKIDEIEEKRVRKEKLLKRLEKMDFSKEDIDLIKERLPENKFQ